MILLPSITVTANGASTDSGGYGKVMANDVMWAEFLLNVTAVGVTAEAEDKLDVYVQASCDDGGTWDDFIHFTQVAANATMPNKELFRWQGMIVPTTANAAPADASLAAGTVKQGPHGAVWRVKWVVTNPDSEADVLFTFSVLSSGHIHQGKI